MAVLMNPLVKCFFLLLAFFSKLEKWGVGPLVPMPVVEGGEEKGQTQSRSMGVGEEDRIIRIGQGSRP